jgi:hypothetical protein
MKGHRSQIFTLILISQNLFLFGQEKVQSNVMDNGNTIIWRIDQPNVKVASEPFPQIVFQKNDEIFISAGGCAQTGGHDKTWKRYVDPGGPNSDRLYAGQISIPGVTLGIEKISNYVNRTVFVPNSPNLPPNMFLTLGYQDDNYNDNGYWGHDDGTANQCKGIGDAWITIKITHHSTPPAPGTENFKEFDVVATDWDVNGLPLNPKFGGQSGASGLAPSLEGLGSNFYPNQTSFPVSIESNDICDGGSRIAIDFISALTVGAFDGFIDPKLGDRSGYPGDHINFMPIAYQGTIQWDSHSKDDDDYNFRLYSDDNSCYTSDNQDVLIEFDSDETVDHYDHTSTWWEDFHHNGVDKSDATAESKVNMANAFIIGLLGIDAQHGPHFELHPAFAFFVEEAAATADTYHFFIRNWGDEGYCSEHKQYLDLNTIKLLIPGASSLTANTVFTGAKGDNISGISWEAVPVENGVLLTFNLKNPDQNSWIEGDLTFSLNPQSHQMRRMSHAPPGAANQSANATEKNAQTTSVEEILGKKINSLSPDARARLYAELKGAPITTTPFTIKPFIHQEIGSVYQRHSAVPVIINKSYIRVEPSAISNKKSAAETIQIFSKYFPVRK